jgi:putative membrane protein insertion efficiency factor
MQAVVIAILKAYKLVLSPLLPSACRFSPTCSVYMMEAVKVHGVGRGVWLGLKRLGRCHPFCEGGYDPVPQDTPVKL